MAEGNWSVVRVEKISAEGAQKTERHNERKNESYANLNVDTEQIARNVHFKDTGGLTYNEYFQRLIDEGKISTRGQKAGATIFNELVIDVNTRYFEEHGGYEYARQFYEEAYRFGCEIYGEENIVSAVMHADEINKAVSEELGKPVYHYHLHIVAIPTDEDGVIPEAAEELIKKHHPKMMYIIPTFQNPTGITLSAQRRPRLAQLANEYGVILAEDDPYRDLRYSGEALPSIKSYDKGGWVVYLSSYSKLVSPGLRVGSAVVSNPMLMRKMVIGKQSADVHSPLLNQAIVDAYLRRGLMAPHIARICESYRLQLEAMLEGFAEFPEGTVHTTPHGGLFVWAALPEGYDLKAMLSGVVEKNVAYVPGTHFYPEGGHLNTIRLNFSNAEIPQIKTGMKALAAALREAK